MAGKPVRLLALVAIYVIVAHVLPAPDGIDAQGWRITGIFFATIAGLMLQLSLIHISEPTRPY